MAYRYAVRGSIDDATIRAVWEKGQIDSSQPENIYRKDKCGHWIKFDQHGREGDYGWEIDHIKPIAKGGPDTVANMQPLYWGTNRSKGDTYPWSC